MAKEKISPIIDASFIIENPKRTISVSPSIDVGLSGKIGVGIPEGTWILLSGAEKCGKTSTALQIAANFQQRLGKTIYYGNVEHRIKPRDLTTHNLDISKMKVIQSERGNIMAAEDHLETYMKILKEESDVVLIIDSGSSLCARDEMDGEIKAAQRLNGPKLLASFCRQMESVVPVQNSVIIIILHVIANTGPGHSTRYVDGGNKIKFQAGINMDCSYYKVIGNDEDGAGYGQEIYWKIKSSDISGPGAKIKSFFRYGYGLDEEAELTSLGIDCGLISKSMSWYSIPWLQDAPKMQGEEKVRQFLKENLDAKQTLITEINKMI